MMSTYRRHLAIAAFSLMGAAMAFGVGAKVGSQLDHQTHRVSVARIPVGDLQPSAVPETAPAAVAHK